MMVKSCEHRLLSFLFLSLGRRATLLLLRLLLSLSGCLQLLGHPVLGNPVLSLSLSLSLCVCGSFGFSFLLLLLVGERGLCFLRQGACPTTYLSRSSLLIVDQGWGAVYGYIGHILGALWGISGWVGSTLQTRTISG